MTIYWLIHKFVNNGFDPQGEGNDATSRRTSINLTISRTGAREVSLILCPLSLLLSVPLDLDEPESEGSDTVFI